MNRCESLRVLAVAVRTLLWDTRGTFWSPRTNHSYSWGTCALALLEVQLRSVCLWLPKPFHLLLCWPLKPHSQHLVSGCEIICWVTPGASLHGLCGARPNLWSKLKTPT